MTEKNFNNVRIINKHDTEENWLKATGFTPKQGELIIYDIDGNYSYERIKIGDGTQNVNDLPFVNDALREALLSEINAVDDKVDAVSVLVGDTNVSDQIVAAISSSMPKHTTVTLPAASWTGDTNPWSQVVAVNGITANSKIDLQPTALQIVEMQDNDIAMIAENDDGVITVYSLGSKPEVDYTMHVLITEVAVV